MGGKVKTSPDWLRRKLPQAEVGKTIQGSGAACTVASLKTENIFVDDCFQNYHSNVLPKLFFYVCDSH